MSRTVMSNATRRAVIAAAVASASALTARGGGSGNTVNDTPGVALFTNAASAITVAPKAVAEYNIGGGTAKFVTYSASSSDTKVATVVVDGTKVRITGVSAGEASDTAGGSLKITVTVPGVAVGELAVNAPEEVTLTPGMTSQYKITGGAGTYSVAVSNPNVIAATVANNVVSIVAANPGTANVVVFDSTGKSSTFEATVTGAGYGVALYTTAPESLRMTLRSTNEFTIHGGTGPYGVNSSDAQVATGSITGNKLTITSGIAGRALINVRDAAGILEVVTVTVVGDVPVPLYSTAPATVTVNPGGAPTSTVEGGSAPYIASTSNADVAQGVIIDGNKLQIKGISVGAANIVVFDRAGATFKRV